MVYFLTKKRIGAFEYRIHWNINILKKIFEKVINCEKINVSVGWNKHALEQY